MTTNANGEVEFVGGLRGVVVEGRCWTSVVITVGEVVFLIFIFSVFNIGGC